METGRLTSIISQSSDVPRETMEEYVGASSIGADCLRQIWYQYHHPSKAIKYDAMTNGFDVTEILKAGVMNALKSSGISLILPSIQNHFLLFFDKDLPYFKGKPDAIWNDEDAIIHIKVSKDSGFKQFVDAGLERWQPKYYSQMQAYLGMSERLKAYVLCINKDNNRIHDETVLFEPEYYSQLKMRALFVHEVDEPPQRINQSPFYIACKSCNFRNECHK